MSYVSAAIHGLLVGASGFGIYRIGLEGHPFALGVCALGLTHGLLGMIQNLKGSGGEADSCDKMKEFSTALMEIVPLPLINYELYMMSSQSSSLALGHGLFIIPLAYDLCAKFVFEDADDTNTNTLKELTILGNVVSLLFLAFNEGDLIYFIMAFTALISKYVPSLFGDETEPNVLVATQALFIALAATAISPGEGGAIIGGGGGGGGGGSGSKKLAIDE